ncbi:MAG: hypothetical protein HY084_12980 [Gemmatimonadetes bacterium]|nr:hypothetical protein [Gemmatimonadota bacterium]
MTPAAAYGAALVAVVAWTIVEGGRAAQSRAFTRPHRVLGALVAFLVAPAFVIWVAGGAAASARAVAGLGWLWPAVAALACAQSVTVLVTRAAPVATTLPVVVWNAAVLAGAVVLYATRDGRELPVGAMAVAGAHAFALARLAGASALVAPWAVPMPLLAGARRARARAHSASRIAVAAVALCLTVLVATEYPHALAETAGYDALGEAGAAERGPAELTVGLRILPVFDGLPPAAPLREDLALADSLDAGALLVRAARASGAGLDSLERALEPTRRDSTLLLASTSTGDDAVERVVRRLRPDYLLLDAREGERAVRAASERAHVLRPATRVALVITRFGAADSALAAMPAGPAGGMDAVSFTIAPALGGSLRDAATLATIDRWMKSAPARREYWIVAAAAPAVFGERAQRDLMRHVIAWATQRPAVRGVIVADGADYEEITGIRTATGRWRPVASDLAAIVRSLADSPLPPTP